MAHAEATSPMRPGSAPPWAIAVRGVQPDAEPGWEARLAIANGFFGSRAAVEEGAPFSRPATFIRGVFDREWHSVEPPRDGSESPAPIDGIDPWSLRIELDGVALELSSGEVLSHERELSLREGVLRRRWRHRHPSGRVVLVETDRRALLDRPDALLHGIRIAVEDGDPELRVLLGIDGRRSLERGQIADVEVSGRTDDDASHLTFRARRRRGEPFHVVLVQSCISTVPARRMRRVSLASEGAGSTSFEWRATPGEVVEITRRATIATTRESEDPAGEGARRAAELHALPVAALAGSHSRAWAERWKESDVEVEGDGALTHALRFAAYHLIASAGGLEEPVLLGSRGLTGCDYRGHAFWDTEIHVLPFFVLTRPAIARALLLGRAEGLAAAQAKAASLGFAGALYAWEAATTGNETTPETVRGPHGAPTEVATGREAHHISADVAHMTWAYWRASGDDAFFARAGAPMVLETARFWASRVEADAGGGYHVRRVVGPDEYHPHVDDDAYTNVMARRNLRLGAAAWSWAREHAALAEPPPVAANAARRGGDGADPSEPARWRAIAERLVDGVRAPDRPTEQFAGYFALEDVLPASLGASGRDVERKLGLDRLARTQIIKQPSVLLLAFLGAEPDDPDRVRRDFSYYEPRCDYASSLAPAVHGAIAARIGEERRALELLRGALDIDLGPRVTRSAGGVHLAALGGAWQAVVCGAAGLALEDDALRIDPRLPSVWSGLRFACCWRGRTLRVVVRHGTITVTVDGGVDGGAPLRGWTGSARSSVALGRGLPVDLAAPVHIREP